MKTREPVELKDSDIRVRDQIIEELKVRTGLSFVNILVYKENQVLAPRTINPSQTVVECRVGNHIARVVSTSVQVEFEREKIYYTMRELANRILDDLIKLGAQSV